MEARVRHAEQLRTLAAQTQPLIELQTRDRRNVMEESTAEAQLVEAIVNDAVPTRTRTTRQSNAMEE